MNSIIATANDIKLQNAFSDELTSFLGLLCLLNSTSIEFLLCPLLTSVAHLMGLARVKSLRTYDEGIIVYSALVAEAATGKSIAMNIVRNCLVELEDCLKVSRDNSRLINAATVEGLLHYLQRFITGISLWDEANTFWGSFGLYKGGGAGNYDRSVFLELGNAPSEFRRDLKQSRCHILNPRLCIGLLGHPSQFIDILKSERSLKDDGLIQRFMLCAPQPVFYKSKDIQAASEPTVSLSCMFMYILLANGDGVTYTLNKKADEKFCGYFDEFRGIIEHTYKVDPYISAMCGKNNTHLLRLSALLQTLHNAFNFVTLYAPGKKHVDEAYVEKVREIIARDNTNEISEANVERAYNLIQFFTKNKLILSGYQHDDWSHDCKTIMRALVKDRPVVLTEDQKIIRFIFNSSEQIVNAHETSQKCNVKAEKTKKIFEKLHQLKIGLMSTKKNGRGCSSLLFEKRTDAMIKEDPQFVQAIESLGFNIDEYYANNVSSTPKLDLKHKDISTDFSTLQLKKCKTSTTNDASKINADETDPNMLTQRKKTKKVNDVEDEVSNEVNSRTQNKTKTQSSSKKAAATSSNQLADFEIFTQRFAKHQKKNENNNESGEEEEKETEGLAESEIFTQKHKKIDQIIESDVDEENNKSSKSTESESESTKFPLTQIYEKKSEKKKARNKKDAEDQKSAEEELSQSEV